MQGQEIFALFESYLEPVLEIWLYFGILEYFISSPKTFRF